MTRYHINCDNTDKQDEQLLETYKTKCTKDPEQ